MSLLYLYRPPQLMAFPIALAALNLGNLAHCMRCNLYFQTDLFLQQHHATSPNHHLCQTCGADFQTQNQLEEHYISEEYYCESCKLFFEDEEELESHKESEHPYCELCEKEFVDQDAMDQHLSTAKVHSKYYCAECKKDYKTENSYRYHINSKLHRPANVPCPLRGCSRSYISQSALVHHLESGACKSRINRKQVNALVQHYDTNHLITDPTRLLSPSEKTTRYIATDASWNGTAFECYLCHKTFLALWRLNTHLVSPAHEAEVYICPLKTCEGRFNTVSGLCQHIESESCGILRFKEVKDAVDGIMLGMKRMGV